jgi:hypothetical protein
MARPKGRKKQEPETFSPDPPDEGPAGEAPPPPPTPKSAEDPPATVDNYGLPNKELFRIDEVAQYFGVSERCIRLWIEHGHLKREKIVGIARVPRASIIACRFNKKA